MGSNDKAEERKRNIQLRQYVYTELNKERNPDDIVKELVEQGMEESKAVELVNVTKNASSSIAREEAKQSNGTGEIVAGSIMMGVGLMITLGSIFDAQNGGNRIVIMYGLIIAGLAVLVKGIQTKRQKKKRLNNK